MSMDSAVGQSVHCAAAYVVHMYVLLLLLISVGNNNELSNSS